MNVDWMLFSRYALVVGLCELIPLPLVDGWVANRFRRRLIRTQLSAADLQLPETDVRMLADTSAGGCLGIFFAIVMWPFRAILRTVLFVLQLNRVVNTFSEVVHHALLIHEALEIEALPGDAVHVRAAINRAVARVDTRIVDKALIGVLDLTRIQLLQLIGSTLGWARAGLDEAPDADQPLADRPEALSAALAAAVRAPGVESSLIERFRLEIPGGAEADEGPTTPSGAPAEPSA